MVQILVIKVLPDQFFHGAPPARSIFCPTPRDAEEPGYSPDGFRTDVNYWRLPVFPQDRHGTRNLVLQGAGYCGEMASSERRLRTKAKRRGGRRLLWPFRTASLGLDAPIRSTTLRNTR